MSIYREAVGPGHLEMYQVGRCAGIFKCWVAIKPIRAIESFTSLIAMFATMLLNPKRLTHPRALSTN